MPEVYIARTDVFLEETVFRQGCAAVDSVRLAGVNACRRREDKARSLCCGLLLQYAMRRRLRTKKKLELRYGYGTYGKPYFVDEPDMHFSLSHSGAYAAAVFAPCRAGIDIQCRRPLRDGVVRRGLSERELARYERMENGEARTDWFFRCWCAKESYTKLTGVGMTGDFRRISFLPEEGKILPDCEKAEDAFPVVMREYVPFPGYYLHVCTAPCSRPLPERAEDVTAQLLQLAETGECTADGCGPDSPAVSDSHTLS